MTAARKKYMRAWRKAHRKQMSDYYHEYNEKNKEKRNEQSRNRYAKNPERASKYHAAWYARNGIQCRLRRHRAFKRNEIVNRRRKRQRYLNYVEKLKLKMEDIMSLMDTIRTPTAMEKAERMGFAMNELETWLGRKMSSREEVIVGKIALNHLTTTPVSDIMSATIS